MSKQITIYLALIFLLFSCKIKKEEAKSPEMNNSAEEINSNGKVDLTQLAGSYYINFLESVPEFNEVVPTVTIQESGKIGGNTGCNNFFGKINSAEGKLIQNVGATRRACQGERGEVERLMIETLNEVTHISKEDNVILFYKDENVVMRGKKLSLEGGTWQVVTLDGEELEQMPSFEITNKRMNGTTGCNSFFGMVEQSGFNLKILEPGMTEMACPDFDMAIESKFMSYLSDITRFKKDGEMTIFFNNDEELFRAINSEQE